MTYHDTTYRQNKCERRLPHLERSRHSKESCRCVLKAKDGDEIEITPEMIEIGVSALYRDPYGEESPSVAVERVYRAMAAAKPSQNHSHKYRAPEPRNTKAP